MADTAGKSPRTAETAQLRAGTEIRLQRNQSVKFSQQRWIGLKRSITAGLRTFSIISTGSGHTSNARNTTFGEVCGVGDIRFAPDQPEPTLPETPT
jgi:hypothetical protein